MITHSLVQGSMLWHAHRAQHFNASDAPAMMGCSPYETRTQLLHRLHTGIAPEIDPNTQRRFDDGHRFEALARPLAEKIIGETLYPVTGSEGKYSASFDGLTMGEDIGFEHKSLNDDLRACLRQQNGNANDFLSPLYRIQMEQQCMVASCEKVLFMASKWDGDTLIEERHCWYTPDLALRAQIVAGWEQFAKDLEAYVPVEAAPVAVAAPIEALPSVSVRMEGALSVVSNLPLFGTALRAFIDKLPAKPSTDQEFADTEVACTALKRAEDALEAAESNALASMADVEAMRRMVADYRNLARTTRLLYENLVKRRKEEIRSEIVAGGVAALRDWIADLNKGLGKPYMPAIPADFGGVIKNKRTVDSIRNAVNTELARAKIAAQDACNKIQTNLNYLREHAKEHAFLFADTGTIVLKASDDFQTLVNARIAAHKAEQEKRLEDERAAIRAEEQAKAEREAREKLAAEQDATAKAAAPAQVIAPPAPAAVAPAPARVIAMPARAPAADPGKRIKLGEINTLIAPLSITADGMASLGFDFIQDANARSARLYLESDLPRVYAAMVDHIQAIQAKQAA